VPERLPLTVFEVTLVKDRNLHMEFEVIQHTNDIQGSKSKDHSVHVCKSVSAFEFVVLLYVSAWMS